MFNYNYPISFTVTEKMYSAIREAAHKRHVTVSEYMRFVVEKDLGPIDVPDRPDGAEVIGWAVVNGDGFIVYAGRTMEANEDYLNKYAHGADWHIHERIKAPTSSGWVLA